MSNDFDAPPVNEEGPTVEAPWANDEGEARNQCPRYFSPA
ncbi:hypothetical protein BH18GEM1_BH18GEM1_10560 [soil metagenome]